MVAAEKPIEIRPLEQHELARVGEIEARSYDFPWSAGIFSDCLSVDYYCRVLDIRGLVSGYAVLSVGAGEAHILNLTVCPESRKQGLGRRLLRDLLDHSNHLSLTRIFLEVRPGNTAARALYESEGFELVGLRQKYYRSLTGREDALVYALKLADSTDNG